MSTTKLKIEVDEAFARDLQHFCEANGLRLGRFIEPALREAMEDHYFGTKAQEALRRASQKKK